MSSISLIYHIIFWCSQEPFDVDVMHLHDFLTDEETEVQVD